MIRRSQASKGMIVKVNVLPLVDVCLVLVIIFMITAPLMMQPVMDVKLPKAVTVEGEEKENITVTIAMNGKIAINEKEVTWGNLPAELTARIKRSTDKFVIIRADENASHGEMLKVMRIARDAGAKKQTIATEQKTK
ncbi:biopolymer transporter ExbD [Candidatus Desantisbacteria bacterium]|nr:biopolymer transporter ExbD [Candidatus Desantisbacteria bacterium]